MVKLLVGADPEIFLIRDKKYISATESKVTGTKSRPQPVDGGAIQIDGTALEFNIEPAASEEQFVSSLTKVRRQLLEFVPNGAKFALVPSVVFDQAYFDKLPKKAKMLGCEPDYDAWTGEANETPASDQPMRTASGHIHLGWGEDFDIKDPKHFEDCRAVAQQLDYYLGINSILWDTDMRRRLLYGRAGAFRPKPYGLEYRVLSNAWLRSDMLARYVYRGAIKGVTDLLVHGKTPIKSYADMARNIINDNWMDWPSWADNIWEDTGMTDPRTLLVNMKQEAA